MEKVKICLIIPSLRNGGSERVMSELANSWCLKNNIEIYLILLTNQEQFYTINSNVNIIEPNRKYNKTIFSKFFYKLWVLYFIRSTCKKIKPTAVLSFNERYNNLVLLALYKTKLKVFVSDRNSPFMNIGRIHDFLRKKLYRKAKGIIAQTQTAKEVLSKNTKNKNIKVIHNPIRKIKTIDCEKEKIILNVGRNEYQKNQIELIHIFNRINAENWKLLILGNGTLKEELEEKVKELKNKNIKILDFQKNIDDYYAKASIFALTSHYEGFPNALLEAMSHKMACISYNCPTGPEDIIQDNINGFLVPLNKSNDFFNKLSVLIRDKELRQKFSLEAEKVKQLYSLKEISNQYLEFILQDEINN